MSSIDWFILCAFLLFVVTYGVYRTRNTRTIDSYIRTGRTTPWYMVTLSIMATQASAITFISTPGQGFIDGMRFIQFYLGLPVAMIILSITAVPVFHKLNVYTAYEYLEKRFDMKNRLLGSLLFLTQRGLAAGFTIFAPALILSVILGWNVNITIFVVGTMVIIYTTAGGTNAVYKTHMLQTIIIWSGMFAAFAVMLSLMPDDISLIDAAIIGGKAGKLNAINFTFDLSDRYTFWSGIIGGTFLMLSYFGTDQSQVQRYLAGSSIAQSRMGLLANGVVKIPMQFFILFTGVMVFVFYQFITPPLFFNPVEEARVKSGMYSEEYIRLEKEYDTVNRKNREEIKSLLSSMENSSSKEEEKYTEQLNRNISRAGEIKEEALSIIKKSSPSGDTNDTNYIFLSFVINFLPAGLIGLVLAAIISASMSSTSAELNALASTTIIDIYKRFIRKEASEKHYLNASKMITILWGLYAIFFAFFANRLGTLIEAVNILGSLVYGTILGIFLVAFYLKKIKGTPVFYSALIAEIAVLYCFIFTDIPFLWFNVISCMLVIFLSLIFSLNYKIKSVN